ncbi:MAG TPA: DUF6624 domain-containing protein [Pyrinomonadaceae bacterium]|jgi:hypothetical protein
MRKLSLAVLLLFLPAAGPLFAQGMPDGDPRYRSLRRELLRMEEEDQRHRTELYELMKKLAEPGGQRLMNEYMAFVKKQDALDEKNRRKLDRIVARYGWPTISMVGKEASTSAFLIAQHGDLAYRKKYFPLLKAAVAKGEARPDSAAMMEDGILMKEGKKQIYGTALQTDDVTKGLQLWPIENEEEVDARRASVGLPPMAEFFKVIGMTYTPPKKNKD